MLRDTLELVALIIVSVVIITRRNELVHLIWVIFNLIALFYVVPARLLIQAIYALDKYIERTIEGLKYKSEKSPHPDLSPWVGWLIIGPLTFMVLVLVAGVADWYLSNLRFAAMLNLTGAANLLNIPLSPDKLLGLMFVILALIWGEVVVELYNIVPFNRPFGNLTEDRIKVLRKVALCMFGLTVVSMMAFYAYGQMNILDLSPPEPFRTIVPVGLNAIIGLLLTTGIAVAGWSVFCGLGALWALVLQALRFAFLIARYPLVWAVVVLRGSYQVVTAFIDVFARILQASWNRLIVRNQPDLQLKIEKTDLATEIGGDIDTPLFPIRAATLAKSTDPNHDDNTTATDRKIATGSDAA